MKLIRRKICNQYLIALAGVAIMVSSMQGMVLCDGENGHFAVELATSSYRHDNLDTSANQEDSTTGFGEAFTPYKDNCGPCVDTPIPATLRNMPKKPYPVNSTPQVSITIIPTTVASYDFSEYQLDSGLFTSVNPCFASLRTIILLV